MASRLQDIVYLIYFYKYNNTFYQVNFVEFDHIILCYSLTHLIFYEYIIQNPLKQCVFAFDMSLFNQNITLFVFVFFLLCNCYAINRRTSLFFAFKNKNCCYLCSFYQECIFDFANLIDWLVWLVHQFRMVRSNKH